MKTSKKISDKITKKIHENAVCSSKKSHSSPSIFSLAELLKDRTDKYPDKMIYSYVNDELHDTPLTYSEFLDQVKFYADVFRNNKIRKGDRTLLIFEQSLEFIIAFFACQWVGIIPIPLNMPGRLKPLDKWEKIGLESQAKAIITGKEKLEKFTQSLTRSRFLAELPLLTIEIMDDAQSLSELEPDTHSTAFFQYTSGSTGNPKGVVVTQQSILSNAKESQAYLGASDESIFISWLPFYHDMGLVCFILQTVYSGCSLYIMQPKDFINKPLDLLRAISKWKATQTGGPNFAYQLIADKINRSENPFKEYEDENISLESLQGFICGAEPVRLKTILDFHKAIARYDARPYAFSPGYGLAESTLIISCTKSGNPAKWLKVNAKALQENKVIIQDSGYADHNKPVLEEEESTFLVSNGFVLENHSVEIVDPWSLPRYLSHSIDRIHSLEPNTIGEIWFSGPSVTQGYFGNAEATSKSYIKSEDNGAIYLRTGDLGMKDDEGHLYVTGRIKDLIIINGSNYYPQDLEHTSCSAHEDLRTDGAAAFSITNKGEESCVLVQELIREAVRYPKFNEYATAIRTAIQKEHGVTLEKILFVSPMHIPRTTSGKIQRSLAKQQTLQSSWKKVLATSNLSAPEHKSILPTEAKNKHTKGIASPELQRIIEELNLFLKTRVNSYIIDERRTIPPYIVSEFSRRGLMGLTISQQLGGLGCTFSQAMRIVEIVSSADLTISLLMSLHNFLGLHPIEKYAKNSIRKSVLKELLVGGGTASFALSEPGAGSNPNAIKTRAIKEPNGNWVLNGEKCWVGSSSWASYLTILAHSHDEKGKYLGLSAFLVVQGSQGLTHCEEAMTMGMRGTVQGHFTMLDVKVQDEYVLGEIGKGSEVLREVIATGRLGINSMCIGILKTVLSRSKRWAENRKVNSGYLIDQPIILKKLNELLWVYEIIKTYQSKFSGWKDEGNQLPELLVSAGKVFSTEETWKGVDYLMQVTAARGYSEHNGVAQLFRDARVLRIFEGPTESLIADIGSRTDESIFEVLRFLANRDDSINPKYLEEEVSALNTKLLSEKLDNHPSRINNQSTKKYVQYAYGEALTYKLISFACRNDISKEANNWLEQRIEAICENALSFDLNHLDRKRFESRFKDVMGEQELVYTDPEPKNLEKISPYSDLALIEEGFFGSQQVKLSSNADIDASDSKNLSDLLDKVPLSLYSEKEKSATEKERIKEVELWVYNWLEREADIRLDQYEKQISFSEYGLDSSLSIRLVSDINKQYNIDIEPSIIWSYPTVSELATYLCEVEIEYESQEIEVNEATKEKAVGIDTAFLKKMLEDELSS